MSFVSVDFLVLFCCCFVLYYAFPAIRLQNGLILIASYIFYAWWDWRFLPLLVGISLVNYVAALAIDRVGHERQRNTLLAIAIGASIAALAVFKYCDFFVESFGVLLTALGLPAHTSLHIVLPLGISFMTFQGIAYVVDVWRREFPAERDLVKFLAFKAFFPQLVAGPIERAAHLLTQFGQRRTLDADKVLRAVWLLVYGYTLKVVVADSMAPIVDAAFVRDQPFGWSTILATIAFGIQIYADFCGYSVIAKGLALLLGFDLVWNFRFPYWATSPRDFWSRWHISLSRWLRDYLYIPLGGNRGGPAATTRNLLVTMGLGGLWHGASWNFVFWGLLHGIALAVWRFSIGSASPGCLAGKLAGWAATMIVVFAGWFLFRATFRATSYELMTGMIGSLAHLEWVAVHGAMLTAILTMAVPLAAFEWAQQRHGDFVFALSPGWLRYPLLSVLVCLCFATVRDHRLTFIYFQF